MLLAGPPGLGKTTLAGIIATEMGARMQPTSGPALERAGDLAAILTNLDDGDVLFIDEMHRLPRAVEEVLYPAMEDFQLDIVIGKGPTARTIRLDLPRFTLVGATTRTGLITGPLRDRFGFVARLDYYDVDELATILSPGRDDPRRRARAGRRERDRVAEPGHAAHREPVVEARARLRRGARRRPRHARHRARRARAVRGRRARPRQGRPGDPRRAVPHVRRAGAVGLGTLAVAVGEAPETVEDVYEPFLLQCGLLERTPRGRIATPAAFAHLGLHDPRGAGRGSEPVLIAHDRRGARGPRIGMPDELVRYEVRDRIAHVTIANGKANALSPEVIAALDAALDARRGRGRGAGRRAAHHRRARDALGRLRPRRSCESGPAAAGSS